jgi:hypothetical protein
MAWFKGRYYYRSRREGRRVVREYIGSGELAEIAARYDELDRQEKREEALALRQAKEDLARLDAAMRESWTSVETVARAALLAAGYRQHKRGEWRKPRGKA